MTRTSIPLLSILAVALGACAPAPVAVSPAPLPRPSPAPAPTPAPVVEPDQALEQAPEGWWLLDPEGDRVRGIGARRAYRELLAGMEPRRSVVVAIIDSGVDIEHEDLDDNLWVNDDEVAANGRDDDNNGYVDDVHGWNFIGGPDGRHVHHDTYEVTRLYARYRARFEGANPDTLSPAARLQYEDFQRIRREFEAERAEAEAQVQQIRAIDAAVDRFVQVLQQALGGGELTVERVRALRSGSVEVARAREVYLDLAAQGASPEVIKEQRESLEGRLRYGLDPDFDPRPIVGDDPNDPTQRVYGNADVEGPAAEHGTHVAGIVGAERDNGIGIDGIAPDNVRLMVVRAVPDGDERDKDVANAIRYAVDNGAHIINMSFGKAFSPEKELVDEAVRYAEQRGVLLVHAAGNNAEDIETEANFPNDAYLGGGTAASWIEVGASSWSPGREMVATFSNYGREKVDVFAPGVDIRSTVPGNEYEPNSGTSMAAPVVSGLAALLMSYFPDLSATEVRRIILDTAVRFPSQTVRVPGEGNRVVPFSELSATGGIVNAYGAIRAAQGR